MRAIKVEDFQDWRTACRRLLADGVHPADVQFRGESEQRLLFASEEHAAALHSTIKPSPYRVPQEFLNAARRVACHRSADRWDVLYRVLWRLTQGEPHLLEVLTDDDVLRLRQMERSVRRDEHKMTAFVRFRRFEMEGQEYFVAWYRPDHRILTLTAPFFAERFARLNWSIATPDESVVWDGKHLEFGNGLPASALPQGDELESLWRTYYASIFNPARVRVRRMVQEMPKRYWDTLPETRDIPQLLADAPRRVDEMLAQSHAQCSARDYLPEQRDLTSLRRAAAACQGCELHRPATQTVFGEGPASARVVLVGEQPGDWEDRAGRPFVGPAGQLLHKLLKQAGLPRNELYITNTVKHFKFVPRGKRRLHKKPSSREVAACGAWLDAELQAIRPEILVCLGTTAAQAILGRATRFSEQRGRFHATKACPQTIATYHPAAILRVPEGPQRTAMLEALLNDLTTVANQLRMREPAGTAGELGRN